MSDTVVRGTTASLRWDSNPRPAHYECAALPAELHRQWWTRTVSIRRPLAFQASALPTELHVPARVIGERLADRNTPLLRTPGGIRTPDLLVRSQAFSSTELRARGAHGRDRTGMTCLEGRGSTIELRRQVRAGARVTDPPRWDHESRPPSFRPEGQVSLARQRIPPWWGNATRWKPDSFRLPWCRPGWTPT